MKKKKTLFVCGTIALLISFSAYPSQTISGKSAFSSKLDSTHRFSMAEGDRNLVCSSGTFTIISNALFACKGGEWFKQEASVPKGHVCGVSWRTHFGSRIEHTTACGSGGNSWSKFCPAGYKIVVVPFWETRRTSTGGAGMETLNTKSMSYCIKT